MKRIDIDAAGRTGHFGAGLTWAEMDAAGCGPRSRADCRHAFSQ
jgi:hypothetical protein